ncbi:MAG: hypothetical protein ACP5LP_03340 [Candidatus Micrarchaeia archaeon]
MRAITAIFLFFAFAIGASTAAYVNLVNPLNATLYTNQTIYIGEVAPGQSFSVGILSNTTNSTGSMILYGWNKLVALDLPPNWTASSTSFNTRYLQVLIKPSSNSEIGKYRLKFEAINVGNYTHLGVLPFYATISINPSVFSISAYPSKIISTPGVPANVTIAINNSGVSDCPFIISSAGLINFNNTESIIAVHHRTVHANYPVREGQAGSYNFRLMINSTQSSLVNKTLNITFIVKPTMGSEFASTGQGIAIFPITYAPIYAIEYLLSKI